MSRVQVEVPEDDTLSVSQKAAKLLGEDVQEGKKASKSSHAIGKKHLIGFSMALVLLVLALFLALLLRDRNKLQQRVDDLTTTQTQNPKDETAALVAEIGQHLELPADETPTLATIADSEKVKSQEFFKNAQNGDKVLLYGKSGKAILYRPSTNKVIEVATINATNSSQTP